jgi:hypothetical protein
MHNPHSAHEASGVPPSSCCTPCLSGGIVPDPLITQAQNIQRHKARSLLDTQPANTGTKAYPTSFNRGVTLAPQRFVAPRENMSPPPVRDSYPYLPGRYGTSSGRGPAGGDVE